MEIKQQLENWIAQGESAPKKTMIVGRGVFWNACGILHIDNLQTEDYSLAKKATYWTDSTTIWRQNDRIWLEENALQPRQCKGEIE